MNLNPESTPDGGSDTGIPPESTLNTNSQNLRPAEAERKEHEMVIVDKQPAETTRDPNNSLDVMEIIDQRDLAKHMVGLAIPMVMALILSTSKFVKATEVRVFVITLSFAIDAIWIGLLLRKTYRKASSVLLMLGIASMMLAFYGFLGCFLPLHLKWIPLIGWLASLIPIAMHGWAHFPRNQVADAGRGES